MGTLGLGPDLLLAVSVVVGSRELTRFHCGWIGSLGLINSSSLDLFYFVVFLCSVLFMWLLFLGFSLFFLFKESFVIV